MVGGRGVIAQSIGPNRIGLLPVKNQNMTHKSNFVKKCILQSRKFLFSEYLRKHVWIYDDSKESGNNIKNAH
jgi:hypothetical protein